MLSNGITNGGDNPPFTLADFKEVYPQFSGDAVPNIVLEMYLELAHNAVKQSRYHSYWKMAMGLFIAHFTTLWVMGNADPGSGAAGIIKAGEQKGLVTGKSVDGVSVSKDYNTITSGLDGWAAWTMTTYGTQLASLARLTTKAGVQIW